jgi:hypothetical protein
LLSDLDREERVGREIVELERIAEHAGEHDAAFGAGRVAGQASPFIRSVYCSVRQ